MWADSATTFRSSWQTFVMSSCVILSGVILRNSCNTFFGKLNCLGVGGSALCYMTGTLFSVTSSDKTEVTIRTFEWNIFILSSLLVCIDIFYVQKIWRIRRNEHMLKYIDWPVWTDNSISSTVKIISHLTLGIYICHQHLSDNIIKTLKWPTRFSSLYGLFGSGTLIMMLIGQFNFFLIVPRKQTICSTII